MIGLRHVASAALKELENKRMNEIHFVLSPVNRTVKKHTIECHPSFSSRYEKSLIIEVGRNTVVAEMAHAKYKWG